MSTKVKQTGLTQFVVTVLAFFMRKIYCTNFSSNKHLFYYFLDAKYNYNGWGYPLVYKINIYYKNWSLSNHLFYYFLDAKKVEQRKHLGAGISISPPLKIPTLETT